MSSSGKLLRVQGLSVRYGDAWALSGVDLSVGEGEIVGVVGESGSGKSTLLKAIAGLLPKRAAIGDGSIELGDVDLRKCGERALRAMRGCEIGFLFQDAEKSLDPLFTVKSQFDEVLKAHRGKLAGRDERLRLQRRALERVGLRDADRILGAIPSQLSGGMNQRVALAMALALSPRVLLADEPTSALDVASQGKVAGILRSLNKEEGLSILMVSHDIELIGSIADRIVVMRGGRVVEAGARDQVMDGPAHPYTRELIAATPHAQGELEIEMLGAAHAS